MVSSQLIELKNNGTDYYVMITQKGIMLFQRYLNIPNEIYNAETGKNEKSVLRASEVVIEEKFVQHQLALNEFVLEFRKKQGNIDYYDEKYLSGMKIIRPDGLIKIGGTDILLEQDMGTESSKQLADKWNKYRRFLTTSFDKSRRIVVVFIIKCQNAEARKSLVRRSIMDNFSQLNCDKFDIYIGTKDEMLDACFERIVPGDKERTRELAKLLSPHKFKISDGSKLKARLGTVYRYYAAAYNKQNKLMYYNPNKKRDGKFMEFLADSYDYCPMSILSKVLFHNKNSHNFDIAYSPYANMRLIPYIIVTRNIHETFRHFKECELLGIERVFITTPERLKTFKLPKALLNFDANERVYSCSDYYFEPTVREGTINDLQINGLPIKK